MTIITPLGTISPYCKYERNCPGFMIEEDKKRVVGKKTFTISIVW